MMNGDREEIKRAKDQPCNIPTFNSGVKGTEKKARDAGVRPGGCEAWMPTGEQRRC